MLVHVFLLFHRDLSAILKNVLTPSANRSHSSFLIRCLTTMNFLHNALTVKSF